MLGGQSANAYMNMQHRGASWTLLGRTTWTSDAGHEIMEYDLRGPIWTTGRWMREVYLLHIFARLSLTKVISQITNSLCQHFYRFDDLSTVV